MARRFTTQIQRNVNYARKRLRQDMERIALSHRGCKQARGCGCLADKSLSTLERAEAELFKLEIDSYAAPDTPKRLVHYNNSVEVVGADEPIDS